MALPTAKVETLRDLAQDVADEADALIEAREDKSFSTEDRADALSAFQSSISIFVKSLPKSLEDV